MKSALFALLIAALSLTSACDKQVVSSSAHDNPAQEAVEEHPEPPEQPDPEVEHWGGTAEISDLEGLCDEASSEHESADHESDWATLSNVGIHRAATDVEGVRIVGCVTNRGEEERRVLIATYEARRERGTSGGTTRLRFPAIQPGESAVFASTPFTLNPWQIERFGVEGYDITGFETSAGDRASLRPTIDIGLPELERPTHPLEETCGDVDGVDGQVSLRHVAFEPTMRLIWPVSSPRPTRRVRPGIDEFPKLCGDFPTGLKIGGGSRRKTRRCAVWGGWREAWGVGMWWGGHLRRRRQGSGGRLESKVAALGVRTGDLRGREEHRSPAASGAGIRRVCK